jgi:hypothetical protein
MILRNDQLGTEYLFDNDTSIPSDNNSSIPLNFNDGTLGNFDESAFGMLPDFDLSDFPGTNWLDFINLTTETRPPQESGASYKNSFEYSFPFLDSFTSKTGFVSSFDCGTLIQREEVLGAVLRSSAKGEPALSQSVLYRPTKDAAPLATTRQLQSPWLNDPLSLKTREIILLVKEVATVKPRNSAVTMTWSPALEEKCSVFFSSTNLQKLLGLYWAIWYPNVNYVHRPTFNPVTCKPILLASMALIGKCYSFYTCPCLTASGACVSPDPADKEEVETWFNCVEEMVFIDDDFCSDTLAAGSVPFNPPLNRRKIEALQAAYHVILYQNWEGTEASKRRMRRYRYSNVVSVRNLDPSVS